MRLWRISAYSDLSGVGGLRASARWHTKGRRVVYLADHPASALLEILVHLEIDPDDLPTNYRVLRIDVPDDIAIIDIVPPGLPKNWRRRLSMTRRKGDAWLAAAPAALMRVPSVIMPDAFNVLLNPAHEDAHRIRIVSAIRLRFDRRLFQTAT
jgi:RES domain-containing protein